MIPQIRLTTEFLLHHQKVLHLKSLKTQENHISLSNPLFLEMTFFLSQISSALEILGSHLEIVHNDSNKREHIPAKF